MRREFTLVNREHGMKGAIGIRMSDLLKEYEELIHEPIEETTERIIGWDTAVTSEVTSTGHFIYNTVGSLENFNPYTQSTIPLAFDVGNDGSFITRNIQGEEVIRIDSEGMHINGILTFSAARRIDDDGLARALQRDNL